MNPLSTGAESPPTSGLNVGGGVEGGWSKLNVANASAVFMRLELGGCVAWPRRKESVRTHGWILFEWYRK